MQVVSGDRDERKECKIGRKADLRDEEEQSNVFILRERNQNQWISLTKLTPLFHALHRSQNIHRSRRIDVL